MHSTQKHPISLNGPWQLHFREARSQTDLATWEQGTFNTVQAQVPGNVECDLERAGILPDLTKGSHIYEAIRLESYQWNYERVFGAPDFDPSRQRVVLNFEGIDCLAAIFLNGRLTCTADNMLIPHAFDITDALVSGENTLNVCIDSAVLEGYKFASAPLDYAQSGKWEAQHMRKAAHMYGWDIMPRIVSAGIWRDVYLEVKPFIHFDYAYWATQQVDLKNHTATLALDWQFTTDRHPRYNWKLQVCIRRDDQTVFEKMYPVFGTRGKERLHVDDIACWWPRGYGEQPLYEATLSLIDETGTELAEHQDRIGIRTLSLNQSEAADDDEPGAFGFKVNGIDVYARGTNWVPLDALHSRDKAHLPNVLPMLADLNCNMVRCWGGNVYEDHDFFNYCDENGIMVWQDFAQACNRSPQTDGFAAKMRHEAQVIVTKLRNHPSLALWCGNNENDVALEWTGTTFIPPSSDRISREVFPTVVRQYDPYRSYLPSSPYVSDVFYALHKPHALLPEDHLWGPRGYFKDPFYTQTKAHFVSEVGYHGCPSRQTLEQMLDTECLYPWLHDGSWNAQWVAKAVAALPNDMEFGQQRNNLMTKQVRILFGEVPEDLDDFILASQITQAEAMKFLVEYWRQGKGARTGMIWWNLRDGWPILSDAIVDYYGRKKLAYSYLKTSQQTVVILVGEPATGGHPVFVINDSLHPQSGHAVIRTASGDTILLETDFMVQPNGKLEIGKLMPSQVAALWLISWTLAHGQTGHNHYLVGNPPYKLLTYKGWLPALE